MSTAAADRHKPRLVQLVTVPQSAWGLMRGQLAWMRRCGFEVFLVSSPGPLLEEAGRREGVATVDVPMSRAIAPVRDLLALFKLWALLRRIRPSIAAVSTPKAGLLGAIAAYCNQVPVRVYTMRGLRLEGTGAPLRWVLWLMERLTCAMSQRVVCVSKSLRDKAVSLGVVHRAKTVVLGYGSSNGVDVSRFRPTPGRRAEGRRIRERLGVPQDAKVVGFVGRLVRDKGVEELVQAFCEIAAQRHDVWLVLLGRFEEGDPLSESTHEEMESNPRVASAGFVKDPEAYYHAMDIVVLPTYREGFPNVPLEAACAELPVITTTATGAVDSVVDGVTGLLVPPRDAQALRRSTEKLLDNPELSRRIGREGRKHAERDFRPERIWKGLWSLYTGMLSSREQPTPRGEE